MNRALILAVLALAITASVRADEVTLRSGRTVRGVIVEDNDRFVRIVTATGKVMKISHSSVEMLVEEVSTGVATVDARLEEIDTEDADELAKVATWAKSRKGNAWRLVAWYAVRADDGNEEARRLLGHVKVGEEWFTSEKRAEKARKDLLKEQLKAGGYVRWRQGWIQKEDKALASKDPKLFMKDDEGIWRLKSEIMRERGFILHRGEWVKAPSEGDREKMRRFEKAMGEEIWVKSTGHFRLYVQGLKPSRIDELGVLVEKIHAWFLKEMKQPPEGTVLRGPMEFWILKDEASFDEWITHYDEQYDINPDEAKWYRDIDRAVGPNMMARVLGNEDPPLENWLALYTGSELGRNLATHGTDVPAWFLECWGLLAQTTHCEKILCTYQDRSSYDADGGVADKEMDTLEAAYERSRGLVRSGEDPDLAAMNQLDTNSLNDDHLAKGLTLLHWLLTKHRGEFVKWHLAARSRDLLAAIAEGFPGWDTARMDKEWRRAVKKK